MSAIRVNIEIGHEASVRSKKTPEGFTHDWEVFVRGQEGAEISHFVEKVVFKLHETFQKPRRGKYYAITIFIILVSYYHYLIKK